MFGDVFKKLRHFDAYPKPLEDFRVKTLSGALISVASTIIIIILFIYEWRSYLTVDIDQELFVDLTRNQKLTINLNMTFSHLPCALLSVDAMDVSGEHQIDVAKGLKKLRLDNNGRMLDIINKTDIVISETTRLNSEKNDTNTTEKCLSCYGAEASNIKCCNTCDDVRNAYRQKNWHFSPIGVSQCSEEYGEVDRNMQASVNSKDKEYIEKLLNSGEGCRLAGHLEVNKVSGNFHIAPGISYQQNHMHFHDIKNMPLETFNTNHFFEIFSFGDEYPNQFNPLERKSLKMDPPTSISNLKEKPKKQDNDDDGFPLNNIINFGFFGFVNPNPNDDDVKTNSISYSYFLKIVPTTYEYLDGKIVNNTYQYSVTRSIKKITSQSAMSSQLPGVFVSYEIAPIMVKFIEKSKSFSHFLTSCCAIIGGLFTIAGMLDAITFRYYNLYKKYQINKLT